MKKPWSITTTLRNPERLRDFLIVLKQLDGSKWNFENQRKYQMLLIKERVYGYGNAQFYNGLNQDQIDLIDDQTKEISFEKASEIFYTKNYEDPAMRGRQSINPLKKIGLVSIKQGNVYITSLGKLFLKDDFDFGEILFRSFLKWQVPNLDNREYSNESGEYGIKPFIGVLQLINLVNKKEILRGKEPKGISKEEFSLFAPTLVRYQDIEIYATKIINLRDEKLSKDRKEQRIIVEKYTKLFVGKFLGTNNQNEINKLTKNLKDYGDNAIRYFRLTRYIYIRGGGFYIDLEPRRSVEIEALLDFDNASSITFESKQDYLDYISDISLPQLPWDTKEKHIEIISTIIEDIYSYEEILSKEHQEIEDYQNLGNDRLKTYILELRNYRRLLQDEENHRKSQNTENIEIYISELEDIFNSNDKPVQLERLSSLGLQALNDAIKIQPNYPVGDDNEPTFTAPANTPDIECYYQNFNAICEVTMLTGRDQWYNEGQPVMRHLRDFENKHQEKDTYCLFIAPKIHRDTINTFWTAIKYEYEGKTQKIIPLSINNFVSILKTLIQIKLENKALRHSEIARLYDEIITSSTSFTDSNEWLRNIPNTIATWQQQIIN